MYEDSWYSFVPDVASKTQPLQSQSLPHGRTESRLQQPNGIARAQDSLAPLSQALGHGSSSESPPEPQVPRRAASFPCLHRVASTQLTRDGASCAPGHIERGRTRLFEALMLQHQGSMARLVGADEVARDELANETLLLASQQQYLHQQDQLALTERHLDGLIEEANAALALLTSLSTSFQSVQSQTSSFQSQCQDIISEQHRLEKLVDQVGTDLHYYAYLDIATRRLNAPGASRLVESADLGDLIENIDACIHFMDSHDSYRERDSYLARYNALLAKALHLLDHGFTAHLNKVSLELSRQMDTLKSSSARHALAYGRFEEIMSGSFYLLPNIQKTVRCAYDEYGRPAEASPRRDVYANSALAMFRTYLQTRDRDLKAMTQHEMDEFQKECKTLSIETACRNYIKQSFEKIDDEDVLFFKIFSVEPTWNNSPDSVLQAIRTVHTSMVHRGHLIPLANCIQSSLNNAKIEAICSVVGWLASEYTVPELDEEESPTSRRFREYAARLLVDHLWTFTDNAFATEITKSITKAPLTDGSLKMEPAVGGVASSNAHPLVNKAIDLLAMFDRAMPKERSAKNSPVVFSIVRETIHVLQRAESRINSLHNGTDGDLFMVKNLLIIKNELVSLEIGDIRSQAPSMQHFGHIWDRLSPQNWMSFFSGLVSAGGSLWARSGSSVTAKTLTAEDMSEQLDELLRQSIYAFTKRWGSLMNDSRSHKAGSKPIAKLETELEAILDAAFNGQPEVVSKLKEAIELNAQAQSNAQDEKRGAKRY
ncbi:hypothetical protein CDD81_4526 [Ophiocordyceps australis]|uniref:Conserved oligomeric Golgi complex subunit 3 n=1 Tax=Ophiocordyceps australis TaxID=1399860 RepID=A0A2C5YC47_9HYPO|nr:hypothetical protein CDD81_4526 [Ophiocordyceps australis]